MTQQTSPTLTYTTEDNSTRRIATITNNTYSTMNQLTEESMSPTTSSIKSTDFPRSTLKSLSSDQISTRRINTSIYTEEITNTADEVVTSFYVSSKKVTGTKQIHFFDMRQLTLHFISYIPY